MGAFSPYLEGLVSPFFLGGGSALFFHLGDIFSTCKTFLSLCVYTFRLAPTYTLTKIFADTYALAAGVVANMSPWRNLREIARLNLLIHFRAHFHIMLIKSMK